MKVAQRSTGCNIRATHRSKKKVVVYLVKGTAERDLAFGEGRRRRERKVIPDDKQKDPDGVGSDAH